MVRSEVGAITRLVIRTVLTDATSPNGPCLITVLKGAEVVVCMAGFEPRLELDEVCGASF